jgi:hypothetical protein
VLDLAARRAIVRCVISERCYAAGHGVSLVGAVNNNSIAHTTNLRLICSRSNPTQSDVDFFTREKDTNTHCNSIYRVVCFNVYMERKTSLGSYADSTDGDWRVAKISRCWIFAKCQLVWFMLPNGDTWEAVCTYFECRLQNNFRWYKFKLKSRYK